MKKCLALCLASLSIAATMNGTIVYTGGPSFQIPMMSGSQAVDINKDGFPDFVFRGADPLATLNVPSTGSAWPFKVDAAGTNQFLIREYVLAQPFDSWITSNAPSNSTWSTAGASASLTVHWQRESGEVVSEGWNGSLGSLGIGYVGVRFHAADGLHYGWIRVRLPNPAADPSGLQPIVVDWAYESQANVPIRAGAISTSTKSQQFIVDSTTNKGSFVLTADSLRCEVVLAGSYSSADICTRVTAQDKAKPVFALGKPLVSGTSLTALFVEVTLSTLQKQQLLEGQFMIRANGSKMAGDIVPRNAENNNLFFHSAPFLR